MNIILLRTKDAGLLIHCDVRRSFQIIRYCHLLQLASGSEYGREYFYIDYTFKGRPICQRFNKNLRYSLAQVSFLFITQRMQLKIKYTQLKGNNHSAYISTIKSQSSLNNSDT